MSKFQESLIRTAAMRSRVPRDMRPLFDHLIRLAKHSHSNPLYAMRAGRELRKARKLARTGYAIPLRVEPFSDVLGSEGIIGAYELPEMAERVGGPYELPIIGGCAPPPSVAGTMWPRSFGMPAARRPVRSLRQLTAIAGASYAIECAGYVQAERTLLAAAGAMLAGWPAGSEFQVACCGDGGFEVGLSKAFYDNVGNTHHRVIAQLKAWGAKLTPNEEKELLGAIQNVQAHATDGSKWNAFGNWKARVYRIRKARLGANQGQDDELERKYFKPLADTYPGGGGIFGSIASAVKSATKAVTNTVSSAAQTLVDGVKKYNPVALAKVAVIKAKALAGDIANSVVFKTLGAIASKALAPALSVIKATVGPILPYVQSVISFVPGVGTGISAALGAAQALADGRSITEAIVAGAKGMLPGGPLAASAFDAAWGLAHGRPVDSVALEALRNQLPGDLAKKAFDTGLALATAKTAQERRNALGTAVLGAVASNVKLPAEVTNIATAVQQAAAPAVAAVKTAQNVVATAQRAVQTANAVRAIARNPAAAAAVARAAALKAAQRAAAAHH